MINSNVASWVLKKVQVGRVQTNNPMIHGLAAHEIGSYMRQREGSFSPRSTNLSGPVLVDVADTFVTRLV